MNLVRFWDGAEKQTRVSCFGKHLHLFDGCWILHDEGEKIYLLPLLLFFDHVQWNPAYGVGKNIEWSPYSHRAPWVVVLLSLLNKDCLARGPEIEFLAVLVRWTTHSHGHASDENKGERKRFFFHSLNPYLFVNNSHTHTHTQRRTFTDIHTHTDKHTQIHIHARAHTHPHGYWWCYLV